MKKIMSIFVIFFITISFTFGYSLTSKDEKLLNSIYNKLDVIVIKTPSKIENLYYKIQLLKEETKDNERVSIMLNELQSYSYKLLTDRNNVEYIVEKVVDGDTINISYLGNIIKVRLIGLDSPESYVTRFGYKECYGDDAKIYLKNLIEGKKINLELDKSQGTTDKYDRTLGYVFYNGKNINNDLIQKGYAWEYTYDKAYKYQDNFKNSEKLASENKHGLWDSNTCNGKRMSEETKNTNTGSLNNDNLGDSLTDYESDLTSNSINFNCSINKMYCSEMTSCEEAKYYLNICGILRLDQDSDGIPCESLCK